jgi:hypothetical protein
MLLIGGIVIFLLGEISTREIFYIANCCFIVEVLLDINLCSTYEYLFYIMVGFGGDLEIMDILIFS